MPPPDLTDPEEREGPPSKSGLPVRGVDPAEALLEGGGEVG